MALSTAKEEYVSACLDSYEVVWLQNILFDLIDVQLDLTCIFSDKQSCVKLLENPMFHEKSKHIEIKYHYIRDMVQIGAVKFHYVATNEKIADVLTKLLARVKFEYFREKLGVLQIEIPSKGK